MQQLAPLVAKAKGIKADDYREVIRELKKKQLDKDAVVGYYRNTVMFAMTGAMLIAASTDLLLLFLGLELMVLPGYMLAAYHKTDGY